MAGVDRGSPVRAARFRPAALWHRLADKAVRWRLSSVLARHPWLAYVFMPGLFAAAFASLVLLNVLVGSLSGQLVYGVVVTTVALWALGQARPVRWLLERWGDPGFSLGRALVWALFAVIAIPVAIDRRWSGVVALALPLVAWIAWRAYRHMAKLPPTRRQGWIPALVSMGLLAVVVWFVQPGLLQEEPPSGQPPPAAPESAADADLARQVRPLLLFDAGESRFPLDIERALIDERVRTCQGDECSPTHIEGFEDLDLGADYLVVDDFTGRPGGGAGSAYYYHVDDKARPNRIYVDFWWYFTRNPSPIGATIGCGPAVRWVGLTCHDHPSDWEGITVVLGPCPAGERDCVGELDQRWAPLAVRYAQHEHVVSYPWATLVRLWDDVADREPTRPAVFVARDSHASYPSPCAKDCEQFAHYLGDWNRDEGAYGGQREWNWNRRCPACLKPIPITPEVEGRGGFAALWNAYPGRWGHQVCILAGTYCDTSAAPRSPSRQARYRDPGASGPWLCLPDAAAAGRKPDFCGEADPDEEIPQAD